MCFCNPLNTATNCQSVECETKEKDSKRSQVLAYIEELIYTNPNITDAEIIEDVAFVFMSSIKLAELTVRSIDYEKATQES